jgi:hypothetical protein
MARPLLERAIEAAGGMARWEAATELTARVRSGGLLLATRARRGVLRDYEIRIATRAPRATLAPYPERGRRGVFEAHEVRVETDGGTVVSRRDHPRAAFSGSLRRNLRWDDLDLLYFAGYAMWNYLTTPFLLAAPGFGVRELDPWAPDGERWERLAATFPEEVPTHCREQVLSFDGQARLRRLDYTPEVIGRWARAAHHCGEHREENGLVVPTRRRVVPRARSGRSLPGPTLVRIEILVLNLA